ncbi:fiber protein [Crane-associated adenovirus 1]|uniref:Fiber protein n=1 Tax=Crane-associated adenovirus 1 TaxID=2559941 RepID=A0A5H2WYN6_9ADEN|nr:fiber protein [Crane-associated adenovirus 1]
MHKRNWFSANRRIMTECACAKRKKVATGDRTINIVYPLWYEVGESDLNPPLIEPDGPLYDDNGKLNIHVSAPLSKANKTLSLNHDSTLETTEEGQLSVKINPEGPLEVSPDGLNIKIDDSLHIDDDWELGLKLKEDQPFKSTLNGLELVVDDTLLIDNSPPYELGVHLSQNGPITADTDGIDLEYDPSTLKIQDGINGKELAVNISPNGGIINEYDGLSIKYNPSSINIGNEGIEVKTTGAVSSTSQGLNVTVSSPLNVSNNSLNLSYDPNTLEIINSNGSQALAVKSTSATVDVDDKTITYNSSNQLSVKLKNGGPIDSDASGVFLLFDNNNFINDERYGLTLPVNIRNLSPYCSFESGNPALTDFSAVVRSSSQTDWKCAYYVHLSNTNGIVNGNLMLKIDKSKIINVGSGSPYNIQFTFVLNLNPANINNNHSNISPPTLFPADPNTITYFPPDPKQFTSGFIGIPYIGGNWFQPPNAYGNELSIRPSGTNMVFLMSTVNYYAAQVIPPSHVEVPDIKSFDDFVLVFTFSINCSSSSANWFDPSNGTSTIIIGPLPFSYQAAFPKYGSVKIPPVFEPNLQSLPNPHKLDISEQIKATQARPPFIIIHDSPMFPPPPSITPPSSPSQLSESEDDEEIPHLPPAQEDEHKADSDSDESQSEKHTRGDTFVPRHIEIGAENGEYTIHRHDTDDGKITVVRLENNEIGLTVL